MKNVRAHKVEGYANRHASKPSHAPVGKQSKQRKAQASDDDAGGVVKQFRSIDQIPDDYYSLESNSGPSGLQVHRNEYHDGNDYVAGFRQRQMHRVDAHVAPQMHSDSIDAGRNLERSPPSSGRSPPLPYEQEIRKNRATNNDQSYIPSNRVPQPPVSNYFGYENEKDFYLKEERPVSGTESFNSAPPLPCDVASEQVTKNNDIYFSKKPRPVEFKPCTVKQFRSENPKEYVMIGNSKPDLNTEELRAKRANLERIKEFSKNLHDYNRKAISAQPKLPPSNEKRDIELSKQKMESKRQKAIEFAKNVPKPKKIGGQTGASGRRVSGGVTNDKDDLMDDRPQGYGLHAADIDDGPSAELLELEAKHNAGRMQIEAIRKTMGLK